MVYHITERDIIQIGMIIFFILFFASLLVVLSFTTKKARFRDELIVTEDAIPEIMQICSSK